MNKRDEVESSISTARACPTSSTGLNYMEACARTLAGEVDAEREIVTKLLAMLRPGSRPVDNWCAEAAWEIKDELHTSACEIAGRTE